MRYQQVVNWRSMLALAVVMCLNGCATHTLRNAQLWYRISVPNEWQAGNDAVIRSQKGDILQVTRVRDDGTLEGVVDSRRQAFQISMTGFVIESEQWIRVNNHKAWKLVGTHRVKDEETVHVKVIVDAKDYKYFIEFRTPSETYRKRRPTIKAIIESFSFKIPEY